MEPVSGRPTTNQGQDTSMPFLHRRQSGQRRPVQLGLSQTRKLSDPDVGLNGDQAASLRCNLGLPGFIGAKPDHDGRGLPERVGVRLSCPMPSSHRLSDVDRPPGNWTCSSIVSRGTRSRQRATGANMGSASSWQLRFSAIGWHCRSGMRNTAKPRNVG